MRDFIDVNDFIEIIYKVINERKSSGQVINVCSGKPTSIKEILDFYIEKKDKKAMLKFNDNLTRQNDMSINYGSNKKLRSIITLPEFKNWKDSILEIIKREKNQL